MKRSVHKSGKSQRFWRDIFCVNTSDNAETSVQKQEKTSDISVLLGDTYLELTRSVT